MSGDKLSKITAIETFVADRVCVVIARTDDGLAGIGQTAPSEPSISADVLHRIVAQHFLGEDPWSLASLVDRCVRAEYKYLGTFLFRAISGVDTALWDLIGKAVGKPVWALLGGTPRPVRLYASSMSRGIPAEDEVARIEEAIDRYGFRCAKIKIGTRVGRDAEVLSGRTRELVPLLRRRVGDDIELSADANGAYSPAQAIRVGRFLENYGFFHLEEPNPSWELDNMKRVADALDIAVGAGEQEFSMEIIWRMVSERLVDVIQPDVCYLGGLTRARRVAELADSAGMPCTPHGSNRSMVQIFTAHLATAMPSCSQFQEWSIEDQGGDAMIYQPLPVVIDGAIHLDDTPGWGVSVQDSFFARAQRRCSELGRDGVVTSGS